MGGAHIHGGGIHAGGIHAGGIHGGGGNVVVGPGGTVVDPGFGVNPGYGGGSGSGCCDVGSECCGPSVGNGAIIGTGPGGGTIVDPGFGVGPPGTGVGTGSACCVGGPDIACGGAGSACCEPAGAMVTGAGWSYVGPGNGDFSGGASYNYVGQGAGAYVKEVSTTFYGWKLRPCCLALLCLLLLLPLLWLLLSQLQGGTESVPVDPVVPIPSPPAPAPTPIGICTVWGDPHVMTFDHMHSDYYSPGEYWIVKSSTIHIQGRYLPTRMTSGLAVTKTLAVGGPLLKGHKLFISADSATCDGQPILGGFPSSFSVPNVFDIQYNNVGTLLQKGRAGKALHIVHIKVNDGTPEGVQIQINRWTEASEGHYINVRITMHKQPGQDGHCGNFNGNPGDDARPAVRSRLGTTGVPPGELLFRTKTPVVAANRPDINNCDPAKLASAKDLCKKKEHKFIPSMQCLVDVCFGGKGFAEEDEDV